MLGILFLIIIVIYLVISLIAVIMGVKKARKRGYKGWQGGLLAAFIMYNLVFWDLIPVYAVHSYQCTHNAGFTVYKTLDEWRQKNPGVAETLAPVENPLSTKIGNTIRYQLNQRFAWDISYEKVWHIVRKTEERIIDTKTGEVLARYIDFSANVSGLYNANRLSDYKFWFEAHSCEKGDGNRTKPQQYLFNRFKTLIKYQYQKEYILGFNKTISINIIG